VLEELAQPVQEQVKMLEVSVEETKRDFQTIHNMISASNVNRMFIFSQLGMTQEEQDEYWA